MATPDPLLRIPHLFHFTDMVNMAQIKELDGTRTVPFGNPVYSLKTNNLIEIRFD